MNVTSVTNNPVFVQPAATVQPTVATTAAATSKGGRRLPKLDNDTIAKLRATHEYKRITRSGADAAGNPKFKTGTPLKVTGAKSKMEKERLVYLPARRLAGTLADIQDYLQGLVSTGALTADAYNAAFVGGYDYANSVAQQNPALEAEIAAATSQRSSGVAASSSGSAAAVVKSNVTLEQLVALHAAMGRSRSKGAGTKTADKGGRKAKSPLEKIEEARAFNTTAGAGQGYKYIHHVSTKNGETFSMKPKSDKAVGVLAREFPLAAKNAQLLRVLIDRFRNEMGADRYNRALAELQAQTK
jgi:hypothetical protein